MMVPTNMTPDQIAAERDHYRKELQLMILRRDSFTETELAEMRSEGVSFDRVTRQLLWTPVNGTDPLVAEWSAYHHAIVSLMPFPECTWTREDLEDMEKNGFTSAQLMADIDEMIKEYQDQRKGQ
jgi:hypothetical protein